MPRAGVGGGGWGGEGEGEGGCLEGDKSMSRSVAGTLSSHHRILGKYEYFLFNKGTRTPQKDTYVFDRHNQIYHHHRHHDKLK